MRREGTDEHDVQMSDVLCDFCHQTWTDDRPMVEGHRGACICGSCLSVAYRALTADDPGPKLAESGTACRMCREVREQPGWTSPMDEDAAVCLRCVKQSATVLDKDPDLAWSKPA